MKNFLYFIRIIETININETIEMRYEKEKNFFCFVLNISQ